MQYDPSKEYRVFGLTLWQQVMLALILGIATGWLLGDSAVSLKVLGTIFLKLIKMVIGPLILFALITGITSLTDHHHFRGIALKGSVAYLITSLLGVCFGFLFGELFKPGVGVSLPSPDPDEVLATPPPLFKEFLFGLIPENIVRAMANEQYLQVLLFALFTGIVMNNIHGSTRQVKELVQQLTYIVFKMIEWIVCLVPLAVFGFFAAMVGANGLRGITDLLSFTSVMIGIHLFQYLFFGFLIWIFGALSPLLFFRKMATTQIMAFSTSSSKATLTTAMRELQNKIGVSQSTSNFMMPLGVCVNLNGSAAYLGLCAVFFAQMYDVHLGSTDYLILLLGCLLGGVGSSGVPAGSIVFMAMILASVGIPIEGIGLIFGVDRILDMFRTMTNIMGSAAITLILDKNVGQLDEELYKVPLR